MNMKSLLVFLSLSATSLGAVAGDTAEAALGGGIGGALGAAIGNEVGGRDGRPRLARKIFENVFFEPVWRGKLFQMKV